jgi:hypothetical protein
VLQEMIVSCLQWWMTSFSSVHFVCFGEERNMNKCASKSWSSCLWKLCELVSNIEEQLHIVFMYTTTRKPISSLRSRNWKWLKKCVHLKCICVWCLDNWFCQVYIWSAFVYDVWTTDLSGKPFNTFSMARLKILQLRLTLTPLSNTTKDPTI